MRLRTVKRNANLIHKGKRYNSRLDRICASEASRFWLSHSQTKSDRAHSLLSSYESQAAGKGQ